MNHKFWVTLETENPTCCDIAMARYDACDIGCEDKIHGVAMTQKQWENFKRHAMVWNHKFMFVKHDEVKIYGFDIKIIGDE